MTKTHKKILVIALFCVIVCFAFCLSVGAIDIYTTVGNFNQEYIQYAYPTIEVIEFSNNQFDEWFSLTWYSFVSFELDYNIYLLSNASYYYDVINSANLDSINNDTLYDYLSTLPKRSNTNTEILSSSFYYNNILPYFYNDYRVTQDFIYDNGYNVGKSDGTLIGYSEGYQVGKSEGYSSGLDVGYNNGLADSNALENGIKTIFSAPIYMLTGILDFEILGFSLYKFILSIITIFVIGFIVKSIFGLF